MARNRHVKTAIWRFEALKRMAAGKYFFGDHGNWRGDLQKVVEDEIDPAEDVEAESDGGPEDRDLNVKLGLPYGSPLSLKPSRCWGRKNFHSLDS
jgi:hypothetical protein